MELSEETACIQFIEKYCNNYKECTVAFHIKTLQDAITEACFAEPLLAVSVENALTESPSERILMLYLHSDGDTFSESVCTYLKDEELEFLINDSFYVLAWDISSESLHNVLKEVVKERFDLDIMSECISKKKSAVFLIITVSSVLNVFSFIHGSVTKENFSMTLNQVKKTVEEEYKIEQELLDLSQKNVHSQDDFCSSSYQQLMYDQLGDRDYDCFEHNEQEYLKDKIGFALWGPPEDIKGYNKKQKTKIEAVYKKIRSVSNELSKWNDKIVISFIYNCTESLPEEKLKRAKKYSDYNPSTDINPRPVFVLRKCKGSPNPCRVFIDHDARVYRSWQEYILKNKLPKCKMILPTDGRYKGDDFGDVNLEEHFSPACQLSVAVLKGADIASTTVALASAGVFVASIIPVIAVAPVALTVAGIAGLGAGAYSLVRGSFNLYDRSSHREDMSFANSDARGAYINIVAGSLGFVGAGAANAVSMLSSSGVQIGQGARILVDTVKGASIAVGGIDVANSTYQVIYQLYIERRTPSPLTVLQLRSSILFFGNTVYNFRTTEDIEESQTRTLHDVQDSFRNNRHRRTFNTLLRNDEASSKTEVIATIRKVNHLDDVIAVLTHPTKNFIEEGIVFSVEDDKILLNGVTVDIGNIHKSTIIQFNLQLPPALDAVSDINANDILSKLKDVFRVDSLNNILIRGSKLIRDSINLSYLICGLLHQFANPIQQNILEVTRDFLHTLEPNDIAFVSVFKRISPYIEPLYIITAFVLKFILYKLDTMELEYQERKSRAQLQDDFNEAEFNTKYSINPVAVRRGMDFFSKIYLNLEIMMIELINDFRSWLSIQIYEYLKTHDGEEKKVDQTEDKKKQTKVKKKQTCSVCGGHFYSKQ